MDKRYTIGVVIGNANSPHTKTLMRGIYDACEQKNVNLIFFLGVHMANYYHAYFGESIANRFDYQHNVVYDYSHLSDVDGLIISYGSLSVFLEENDKDQFLQRFEDIPYVLIEDRDNDDRGSSIISDNYRGMYDVVEHLITVHHYRKFIMLSGPKNNTDSNEREQAFRDALHKYGIPLKEDMIEEGDYSHFCNKPIRKLLDRYPDAEAMVCANDVMADVAYEECAKRGLVVGKDIAITGYDNWDMAETMAPPLTTVYQNELEMGYIGVEEILRLCNGEKPRKIVTHGEVMIRSSCGCASKTALEFPVLTQLGEETEKKYMEQLAAIISRKVILTRISNEMYQRVHEYIRNILNLGQQFIKNPPESRPSSDAINSAVYDFIFDECSAYISSTVLAECIHMLSTHNLNMKLGLGDTNDILELDGMIQFCIQNAVANRDGNVISDYEQDTMLVPLVSRDMMNAITNEKAFFEAPMQIISVLHTKRAYLYILDRPVKHTYGKKWRCPGKIRLASSWDEGKITYYDYEESPFATREKGVISMFSARERKRLTVFGLFLGEYQYGVLMVEINPRDMMLMYLVSMQISSSLNYFYIYQKQMRLQNRMERLIEEVNEKNKILGFISEYDELTGLLNRRGFMEKALHLVHEKIYDKAILIIADLDHLKQINDNFGHVEGDFAIRSAAEILKNAMEEGTLLGRIGGDEFLAILPYDSRMSGEVYTRRIREAHQNLNERCDKAFYVEISSGYAEFDCSHEVDLEKVISDADEMLYDAKLKRRKSVKKTDK